jgi:hypothetical protein
LEGLRRHTKARINMAMLGLRAGSGFTVGLLGTLIGVRLSLVVSSLAIVLVSIGLLARQGRGRVKVEGEVTIRW